MPLVKIEIQRGHSAEYKSTLLAAVHDALENALQIPEWDRYQRLYELDRECFEHGNSQSDTFCFIELTIYPGRSRELKKAAISEITRLLGECLNIPAADVFITINEPPLDNWGLDGIQASEQEITYKTE